MVYNGPLPLQCIHLRGNFRHPYVTNRINKIFSSHPFKFKLFFGKYVHNRKQCTTTWCVLFPRIHRCIERKSICISCRYCVELIPFHSNKYNRTQWRKKKIIGILRKEISSMKLYKCKVLMNTLSFGNISLFSSIITVIEQTDMFQLTQTAWMFVLKLSHEPAVAININIYLCVR